MKRQAAGHFAQSKLAFYADFMLCPGVIGAMAAVAWIGGARREAPDFATALVAGAIAWTLIEYALHRFVLHRVPPFRAWHAVHHAVPRELIGAPAWLSPLLLLTLFTLTWRFEDLVLACGVAAGVAAGYLVYVSIHYATHHLPGLQWAWLRQLRCDHALHHRSVVPCNFGVSTRLWDRVFGTAAVGRTVSPGPTRTGR